MHSLLQYLSIATGEAFAAAGFDEGLGTVVYSDSPAFGQFQCNGALAGAKRHGLAPRQLADQVVAQLQANPDLTGISVAGPGFINFSITDRFLSRMAAAMAADPKLGAFQEAQPLRVFIDFGGPNVAKPMHVGHLRSSIIGDSLQRLYRFVGNSVSSDIHLGDWGTQMGMILRGVERDQPGLPYFDQNISGPYPEEAPVSLSDLETIYPREAALCKEDPAERQEALRATVELQAGRPGYIALWKHFVALSLKSLRQDFEYLGVHFDEWNGESHYNEAIPSMLDLLKQEGYAQESNGALVVFVGEDIPPLILVKSDGAYLYGTTDMATINDRVMREAQRIVYVVDGRQELHFRQVFAAARLTGLAPESVDLRFLGFGTMNGQDGKPFKTRAGGVMKLNELISLVTEKARERMAEAGLATDYPAAEQEDIAQKVGLAALKFADLINNRSSDYIFDLERFSSFEGKTGPYLIYSGVRIKSIFRKIEEGSGAFAEQLADRERELLLVASAFPEAVRTAYELGTPHVLGEQAFKLCQSFNRFYQECNILREEDVARQASWVATSSLVLRQLAQICEVLGIEIPERM